MLMTTYIVVLSYSEVVITLDFESSILGSNPGKRTFCPTQFWNLGFIGRSKLSIVRSTYGRALCFV